MSYCIGDKLNIKDVVDCVGQVRLLLVLYSTDIT